MGLVAVDVPDDIFPILFSGDPAAPKKIVFFVTPAIKAVDIQLEAVMADAEKANNAVKMISRAREDAIRGLKMFGGMGGIPDVPIDGLIQLLESVQVEGKEASVHVRLLLPETLIRSLVDSALQLGARDLEPVPLEKK